MKKQKKEKKPRHSEPAPIEKEPEEDKSQLLDDIQAEASKGINLIDNLMKGIEDSDEEEDSNDSSDNSIEISKIEVHNEQDQSEQQIVDQLL